MRRSRRAYYDLLSHFYDFVVALHPENSSAELRDFLMEKASLLTVIRQPEEISDEHEDSTEPR